MLCGVVQCRAVLCSAVLYGAMKCWSTQSLSGNGCGSRRGMHNAAGPGFYRPFSIDTCTGMSGEPMVLLDDDAVDAGVQDDLDEEMWEDAGDKNKRRKKRAELTRYDEYQQSQKNPKGPQQEEHADVNEDDANDLQECVEDEGECVEDEDEEGSELVARQARQRKRAGKRSCTISDSDE